MEAHDPALHADDVALQSEVLGSFGFLRYMVEKSTESVLSLAGLVPGTAQMAQQKTHNDMQALWAHYNGITMCEHAKEMQLSPTYLPGVEKATVMGELTLLWEKPEDNLYAVTRVRPGKGHKAGPGGPPDDAPADDCPGLVRWLDHVRNLLHFLTAALSRPMAPDPSTPHALSIVDHSSVRNKNGVLEVWVLAPDPASKFMRWLEEAAARGFTLEMMMVVWGYITLRMRENLNSGRTYSAALHASMSVLSPDAIVATSGLRTGPRKDPVVPPTPKPRTEARAPRPPTKDRDGRGRRDPSDRDWPGNDGICTDYQRNVCDRAMCRYEHVCRLCHRQGHGASDCKRRSRSRSRSRDRGGKRRDDRRRR